MSGNFTGRHITAILVVFFGVVVAVNLAMARYAIGTFGGVVVENSYVASQQFNRWLDEGSAEQALGWGASARRTTGNRVELDLTGPSAQPVEVKAVARHPLGRLADQVLTFTPDGAGHLVSRQKLPSGRWRLRLEVSAEGRLWRHEQDLF